MLAKKLLPIAILGTFSVANNAFAADEENTSVIAPVVVTATRIGQKSFDLPVAIDLVRKDQIQDGQLGMTLSESLIRVPGITAQNRTQMAQDPQISTRGFGARSAFGVRGVRVYVDGIPLTMPDGQGQPGNVDLDVVRGIEVMRGPFSALYGNSSGGVVQMLTENAPKTPEISGGVMFGSYGTQKESVRAAGTSEGIEYLVNYSNYKSDGYRDHSANQKEQGTAKFKINLNEDTKLTTLVNWFDQDADDPLGSTRAMAFSNPKSVVPAAINANTRVSRSNTQVGFNLEHAINSDNSLTFISYVGTRDNLQILSTNAPGTNARASKIAREFYGTDIRWDNKGSFLEKPYTFSLGTAYGKSTDDRTDTNILLAGAPINVLNRNEKDTAKNFDQYAQAKWSVLENLDLHAGVRHTKIRLEIDDNLLAVGGDNSGNLTYQKTTPVFGAIWKVTPLFNLYANYGKGFETPTFVEVAYRNAAATSTPNLGLKPSESRNMEIGAKAFLSDNTIANLSIFKTLTDDEIIVSNVSSGITSYTNANKTKRNGAEASIESKLPYNVTLFGAYTLLNAKFDSDFTNNSGLIEAGNVIPGTYHTQIYGEAAWKHTPTGFRTAFEARHNSKSYVNDLNTDSAPSYTIFNIRAGFEQKLANWRFSEYARIENIFDKDYIGSVKLNDYTNGRSFEPAAGRNWLIGLNANYRF
ncbi:MAG: TonB-dependent receptor family protein [Methylophilaceae bacterium]